MKLTTQKPKFTIFLILMMLVCLTAPALAQTTASTDGRVITPVTAKGLLAIAEAEGVTAKTAYRDNIRQVIATLKELLNQFPECEEAPMACYRIGYLQETELGNFTDAVETYRQCIYNFSNNSWSANAYMRLAGLLENEVKEYEEALYILEKCSRDYGNFETGVTSRLKMISLLNDKIKDSSRTIDSCRAFIQLYPEHEKSAPVYKQLADLYRAEGNNEDSRKVLDQLIKNFPDSEIAQRTILDSAEIYRAERNYQKEAEELTRFVEKFPESAEAPKAALMIGQIHARNLIVYKRKMGTDGTLYKLKRGSYRDAIKKYEEAYQLYPETAFGRQALLEAANVYLDSLYEKSKAEEVLKTLVDVHANTAEGLKAKELIKARM